jgi:hypothetical protein
MHLDLGSGWQQGLRASRGRRMTCGTPLSCGSCGFTGLPFLFLVSGHDTVGSVWLIRTRRIRTISRSAVGSRSCVGRAVWIPESVAFKHAI